jgi:hypothetical protein
MSEILQTGLHPDADQLSAFVERVLPAHERERTLAHLAACPTCRAVVALSMPSVEEPAKPQPKPVRGRWFSGWNMAWSAALAMAATIFLTIYIYRAATTRNAPAQMASSLPLPRPAVPARPRAPSPERYANPQPESAGLAGKPKPAEARSLDELNLPASASSSVTSSESLKAAEQAPAADKKTLNRLRAPQVAFGSAAMQAQLEAPSRINVAPAARQSDQDAAKKTDSVAKAMAAVPPAPEPLPRPADAAKSSATVAVSAAAPSMNTSLEAETPPALEEESVLLLQQRTAHPLPSHLPVVSMAAHERLMVAIDANNTVFLSTNAGKRWKAIRATWTGRAVKADLVSYGTRNGLTSVAMQGRATGGLVSGAGSLTGSAGRSLSGVVTDATGAVIPGATVVVGDSATGLARTVKTDSAGRYRVDGLAPGTYEVKGTAQGFEAKELDGVRVSASAVNVANLSLQVGAETQSVMVTEAPPLLQTDHAYEAKKKSAPKPATNQAPALFEITTDGGEHWTSADGLNWTRK